MLRDTFGRPITYLRISVTDRCNLRCVYCMPAEGVILSSHESILRFEEIEKLVAVAAENGIREVRLTGGEPLVRRDLPDLIRKIARIPGIEDISLTTNGLLLEKVAPELAAAGLKRINISIDTLDTEKFNHITRGGSLQTVWNGILMAEACGLRPVKLNVVAMRGVNDGEFVNMARLSITHPWHVRFIELMPVKNQTPWGEGFPLPEEAFISVHEIMDMLRPLGLESANHRRGSGPARQYRLRGAMGYVGFISPIGEHFCGECNRLRLTSDGALRPCLLSDAEVPVMDALRSGQDLLPLLEEAVRIKPEGHELSLDHAPSGRCMRQIGG